MNMQVIWKFFYSNKSAADHGSLYQLRNKLNRTNVVNSPKKDVNACEDFLNIVTSSLIVSTTCVALNMKSKDDCPSEQYVHDSQNLWTKNLVERQEELKKICELVYEKYISFQYNGNDCVQDENDQVFSYSLQLLRFGCFFMEFSDAIREGDGDRVMRCWKYFMVIFCSSGNKNYACESLNVLLQNYYTLSPRLSSQLKWNRFVNTHGRTGRNIPVDLEMEHLNKIAKSGLRYLGSNKSEESIKRVGRAIGTVAPLLESFDSENHVHPVSSAQKRAKADKDVEALSKELLKAEVLLRKDSKRKFPNFPKPFNPFKQQSKDKLMCWIADKLPPDLCK